MGQWRGNSSNGSYCLVNVTQRANLISGRISVFESVSVKAKHLSFWTWSYFTGVVSEDGSFVAESNRPSVHWQNGDQLTNEEWIELNKVTGIEIFAHL